MLKWGCGFALGIALTILPVSAAVIGKDERRNVPNKLQNLSRGIGSLITKGSRQGCTAFCVAGNVAATAAHCLLDKNLNKTALVFPKSSETDSGISSPIAGFDQNLAASHVVFGISKLRKTAPINVDSDWALLRLSKPVCRRRELPVVDLSSSGNAVRIPPAFMLAIHGDFRRGSVSYSGPCRFGVPNDDLSSEFQNSPAVLMHNCDSGAGASGAPVLIDGPRGLTVIGMNNGVFKQKDVDGKIRVLRNTGTWARSFHRLIFHMSSAKIDTEQKFIDTLRIYLVEAGAEDLSQTGPFDMALREAIQAFQRTERLPETGLPEQALLKRFEKKYERRKSRKRSRGRRRKRR